LKNKVKESEKFYNNQFLNIDYQLNYYNYITLKEHFVGNSCLELGPASGFMTERLVKDFSKIVIVEGSKYLLDQITEYPNVLKVNSLFEDYNTKDKFDTIIMSHVLEHIYDPVFVLSKIKKWLNKGGNLLISVPNANSYHRLIAVEMGILKNPYELNERDHALGHYRVYDLDLLSKDVLQAGFNIRTKGGIFFKPLSNSQIEKYLDKSVVEGFYNIGKKFPNNCAEIFIVANI